MGNETEVIRQQMAETRSSLQDKLETLEQQVKETVQEATDSVQTVKEAVQETVGTVKETVQDTVESVKGTVQDTVESVKQSLNVSDHVRNHPWLFFAGAATVGFVGTRWLSERQELRERYDTTFMPPPRPVMMASSTAPAARPNGARPAPTASSSASEAKTPSFWSKITEHYGDELKRLQGLAIGTVAAVVRQMIEPATPPAIAEQVHEILDSFTTKLGGTPVHGPLFASEERSETNPAEYRHDAGMQRPEESSSASGPREFEMGSKRIFNTGRDR
jgi:ElaB/YqjD/DUF883 family membrane-anchored ribosome-binding protein